MSNGFKGHKDYGQYAGDYVANVKALSQGARNSPGGQNFDKLQRYQARKEQEAAIDSGNVNFDMGLVPEKYKEQVKAYIIEKAREKGKIELQLQKFRDGGNMQDPMYMELKMQASQLANELGPNGSLTTQWTNFNKRAAEYTEDALEGALSDATHGGEAEHINSRIFGNYEDLVIENGQLFFGNSEMGFSNFNDVPEVYNKDYVNANKILAQTEKIYDKGEKLSDNDKLFYGNSFQEMMNQGGVNTVMSLAFDKLWSPNPMLDKSNYKNIIAAIRGDDAGRAGQAMEILKKDLQEQYMILLNGQANAGYNKKNPKSGNDPSSKNYFDGAFGDLANDAGGIDLEKYKLDIAGNSKKVLNKLNRIAQTNKKYANAQFQNFSVSPDLSTGELLISYNQGTARITDVPLSEFMKDFNFVLNK
tara:strand:+ start:4728 stop:5981 length:1254 start_codon:yes stop_codon:yes gene_type:complete